MAAYAASVPITILRNDTTVQAVENASLGLTEAAFYASGQLQHRPGRELLGDAQRGRATLLLQQSNSGLTISASNPLAAALSLQIEVGLPLANAWNPAAGYSTVTLNLAGGSMGGSSVPFFPFRSPGHRRRPRRRQAGSGTEQQPQPDVLDDFAHRRQRPFLDR